MDFLTHVLATGRPRACSLVISLVLLLLTPMVEAAVLNGEDTILITDVERFLSARDQSEVTVGIGGEVGIAFIRDEAQLTMLGGSVDWLSVSGEAQAEVVSGSVSVITVSGNSYLTLDSVSDLSRLVMLGNSQIEIYGSDIQFDGRYLTGYWGDGSYFNVRTNNWTGVPTNGLPGYLTVNSQLSAVPVPAALWLFASALVGLGVVGRRRVSL